ncbi:hypothetical protein QEH52_05300 [Coraliomargarita sp. SDUM461003]|uniref:Uncharacterized protein n=1 Tax=Thalassobacterium maritimum TaxID=3041265 RepID=A0ABU1ARY0_9BACT|nr:hypothetical protein [Coraliomargarita sp. SDUM461003]MDQ8206914.1 hypothetical protein [Coraliomargarita sp. SDUM461003]
MSEIPELNRTGPIEWRLALPDWGRLDTVWERRLPFALWHVGEQALLFHWLDAAVDQGSEKVVLYISDRPSDVRKAVEKATLWPIEIEIVTVPSIQGLDWDDCINHLPRTPALTTEPEAGWGLIKYWHQLEQDWLTTFTEETKSYGIYAAIGRSCEIASDAKLNPPFWLGNHVSIGPGSVIGPGAVVEDGCIVAGMSRLERAHLAAHTYLGPETDLVDSIIHRNNLLNMRHGAYVRGLEGFVASSLQSSGGKPHQQKHASIRDRLRALRLLWRWRNHSKAEGHFQGVDGKQWPCLNSRSIEDRGPWLGLVMKGKLALFGITPREASTLDELPEEWQSILRKAPLGAFSYADVMGAHEPGDMDEALHCVYHATTDEALCRQLFDNWLMDILGN